MSTKLIAIAGLALLAWLPQPAVAFEPVYEAAPDTTLHARLIGRRDGGLYLESAASTPPAYHPGRKWLYVISQRRYVIEVIDISDPRRPRRVKHLDREDFLRAFGRGITSRPVDPDLIGEIRSVAYADEVLAVAFAAIRPTERGRVLFFDPDGDPTGDPVRSGVDPDAMAFTPDGRKLVLASTSEASGDDDPEANISIIRVTRRSRHKVTTDVNTIGFSRFNGRAAQLRARGVRIFGPGATVAEDLEPESVTIAPDGSRAWVSVGRNNAVAEVDLRSETLTAIHGLGTRDLNRPGQGIDASDRDGRVNIRPWPLRGYYQPDGIGVYPAGSPLYLVTANEGDPRDDETARVGSLRLDPSAFPQASLLQRPENLGRLGVTRVEEDRDRDGDHDQLLLLGTRSLSVWTTSGQQLFDSGDAFERVTARAVPRFFNTGDDFNRFDARSDDRGPEPEPLAVGEVAGRWYAFVGFERIGGVIAYDVTDPARPAYAFYLNNRNFAVDPGAVCEPNERKSAACAAVGDIEPEALLFIPAERSPNGMPLLVVTHEQTDSLIVLELRPAAHATLARSVAAMP